MADFEANVAAPAIDRDYYLAGSRTPASGFASSHDESFMTRAEKYAWAECNFPEFYKAEWEEELPAGTKGIIVIQHGRYPVGYDILVNPDPAHYCAKQAVNVKKVLHQPYVYASCTYWLKDGAKKLERLMDSSRALLGQYCRQAVDRYLELKGAVKATALGTCLCTVGRGEYPYRVWKLQGAAMASYLMISLLNGAVFEVSALPECREAPDKFFVGDIRFTAAGNDDYSRE